MDEAKTADGEGALDVGALLEHAYVEMHDLVLAVRSVQPSAKREGFAIVPDVTWSDVGALAEVMASEIEASSSFNDTPPPYVPPPPDDVFAHCTFCPRCSR